MTGIASALRDHAKWEKVDALWKAKQAIDRAYQSEHGETVQAALKEAQWYLEEAARATATISGLDIPKSSGMVKVFTP